MNRLGNVVYIIKKSLQKLLKRDLLILVDNAMYNYEVY